MNCPQARSNSQVEYQMVRERKGLKEHGDILNIY